MSWPSGTVGTVLASKQGCPASRTYRPCRPAIRRPLHGGELRSLISALSEVQRGCNHGVDPLWSELRDLAQEDVTARDSRRFW